MLHNFWLTSVCKLSQKLDGKLAQKEEMRLNLDMNYLRHTLVLNASSDIWSREAWSVIEKLQIKLFNGLFKLPITAASDYHTLIYSGLFPDTISQY